MAATGSDPDVQPWVETETSEREALTLETVKLAVELGADLNVANTDGRTALDAAKACVRKRGQLSHRKGR